MNRAAVIEQLKQAREILDKLLAVLAASEADKFAAHLYQSRRQYRRTCERPNKGKGGRSRGYLKLRTVSAGLFWRARRTWRFALV